MRPSPPPLRSGRFRLRCAAPIAAIGLVVALSAAAPGARAEAGLAAVPDPAVEPAEALLSPPSEQAVPRTEALPPSTEGALGASPSERPQASPLELRVNLPAFRLDALVDGAVVASYPVTIGMPTEPTPEGRFVIDHVVWNPWWHPPAHRRPKDRVTPPGPNNPMGRVKLHFAADLYFVHGTAKSSEIGRATSRGCVRMRNEDAIALARLVHEHAGPALDGRTLERLIASPGATRKLQLERPVRLTLVYELEEMRDGLLALHEDVYGRGTVPAVIAAGAR